MELKDNSKEYCIKCDNTGICKMTKDADDFNYWYDKYDDMGTFSLGECYDKAMDKSGYTIEPCPFCLEGKNKMIDK